MCLSENVVFDERFSQRAEAKHLGSGTIQRRACEARDLDWQETGSFKEQQGSQRAGGRLPGSKMHGDIGPAQ